MAASASPLITTTLTKATALYASTTSESATSTINATTITTNDDTQNETISTTIKTEPANDNSEDRIENNNIDNDDDDDMYEYIEYELLTEKEFRDSEWLIGTNWNDNPNTIQETWVRLIVDTKSGKNIAIWGDNSQGTWNLDVASQFLSISKEYKLFGKDIWAVTLSDFYYLQGTVRGWKYWTPAAVLGQWQAKRLKKEIDNDDDDPGIAPWFENSNDDEKEVEV